VPLCRTGQPVAATGTAVFGNRLFKKVFSATGAARSSMSSTKAYRGGEMWLHSILTSVLDGGKWPISRSGYFTPSKEYPVPIELEAG